MATTPPTAAAGEPRRLDLDHQDHYDFGALYGLFEASLSDPADDDGFFSVLAEGQAEVGRTAPFYRVEYATRPEYGRRAADGSDFFRYDHGHPPEGATRWLINTMGVSQTVNELPASVRPFVEVSHNRVQHHRGPDHLEPTALFGHDSFWSVTVGVRLFLGGGPMRMGTYGVLDDMSAGMRATHGHAPEHHDHGDEEHHHP